MATNIKPVDQKSTVAPTTAPRIVPGAPPPTPLTRSQKKKMQAKRKPALSTGDHQNASEDGQNGTAEHDPNSAVPESAHQSEAKVLPEEEIVYKPSPITELINKRLKATTKKIARISTYATMDVEKLDDGQRQTLKTLPGLEAIQKELGEVKKAVEAHEAEIAHEQALKRIEAEQAEKKKIHDAVLATEASYAAKVSDLLDFLRFHSILSAVQIEDLDKPTISAVISLAETLVHSEDERKQAALQGFLTGEGDFQGTSYKRFMEITQLYFNPPRLPTPIPEEPEEPEPEVPASMESTIVSISDIADTDVEAGGVHPKPSTGSFHFMQASELEPAFEENVEWVEPSDAVQDPEGPHTGEEVADSTNEDGQSFHEEPEPFKETSPAPGPIDWADEEGDLPSIDVLQAKFGTSGTATPVTPSGEVAPQNQNTGAVNGIHANGAGLSQEEDDGFTQARGGRGRGRGFRGDRGPARGGHRGFGRGDRFRGGFRGDRERGGFRGRSSSSGEWRGDGEFRGRGGGRNRGRGGDRGGRGEGPPPSY